MPTAIIILNQHSVATARQIASLLPDSRVYGSIDRVRAADVDETYQNFGDIVRSKFQQGDAIVGLCAAGILIRTVAPLLQNKWQEPAIIAVAEDGSVVVPLLGGLQGANHLARQIGDILGVAAAVTTSGDIRFQTALLSPPTGYTLANPDAAKNFLAELLAGAQVKIQGDAPWLAAADLPIDENAELTIQIAPANLATPSPTCLVYHPPTQTTGEITIVGTGPGGEAWLSPEVRQALIRSTDWVGYTTYLNLVEHLRRHQTRHDSDNREEIDRAKFALDLAAQGKSVVVISSGDPGIYAMAAAVFEALDRFPNPAWADLTIRVCPGISAMQAAAARIGAPLGHDFCTISLSDILKPWQAIADRLKAAASNDFAIAIYNPKSSQRTSQLDLAREILLRHRHPATPVVLARNLGRSGEEITVKSLGELQAADADMRTVIIIGSSKTKTIEVGDRTWVYTPRYYESL